MQGSRLPELRALRLVEVRLSLGRLLVCLLTACLFAVRADAGCQVEKRAAVPVRVAEGVAVVDVVINAHRCR